jgi:hypothetical protein
MKLVLGNLPQLLVMSCIVATLFLFPVLGIAGLVGYYGFELPFNDLVTFKESVNDFEGVVAWWLIVLVPAIAYSSTVMPWHGRK